EPRIAGGDAERDVIVQVPARAHEGRVARWHVRGKRYVTEHDGGRRRAEHPEPFEGRPAPLRTAGNPAGGLAHWRLAGAPGEHRRVEMPLVPELRTERVIVEEVHVVEPLGRMVARVFDERSVGTSHVPEAAG